MSSDHKSYCDVFLKKILLTDEYSVAILEEMFDKWVTWTRQNNSTNNK